MDVGERCERAVRAAVAVGRSAGFLADDPLVLQDTNNVVIWLRPHPVIAKVGTWPHSAAVLGREVEVCAALHAAGAPVGEPLGPVAAGGDCTVSLWRRLDAVAGADRRDADWAAALQQVHEALDLGGFVLPSYTAGIDLARAALFDDDWMRALPRADLEIVRVAFDRAAGEVRQLGGRQQPLHGEPHADNVVFTARGPVIIDFEAVCRGPLEWDLASLPAEVAAHFPDADAERSRAARLLNSARVATWCFASGHPGMRPHGELHLEMLRRA